MVCRSILLASLAALVSAPAVAEIGRIKTSLGVANVQRGGTDIPAATGQRRHTRGVVPSTLWRTDMRADASQTNRVRDREPVIKD